MTKKLYKSRTDSKIDGVCGGIAKYFNIDSTLVRLIFFAFCLAGCSGIVLYIVCMIIIPREPAVNDVYDNDFTDMRQQ